MSYFRSSSVVALSLATAWPAAAATTFQLQTDYIDSNAGLRAAFGIADINPRFSAGLLVTIGTTAPGAFYDFGIEQEISRITPNIYRGQNYYGWSVSTSTVDAATFDVPFDHDRAHDDPDYPHWLLVEGNRILFLFDWGQAPAVLEFDFDTALAQTRTVSFQPYQRADIPFDDSGYDDYSMPGGVNTVEGGAIRCTATGASEVGFPTYDSSGRFMKRTHRDTASARCTVSIATAPFVTPPLPDVPGAVPEPATWAMMIAGFALIGQMSRRRGRAGDRVSSATDPWCRLQDSNL